MQACRTNCFFSSTNLSTRSVALPINQVCSAANICRIRYSRTNRGGQATYHGPGQLIGYPIIDLRDRRDLHKYLRALEQSLIGVLQEIGVSAARRDALTGVWVGPRKIASIGVGVRRWITMHGFALNVCGDLSPFEAIVPCGITGVEITSIERETERNVSVEEVAHTAAHAIGNNLGKAEAPTAA
jgi:lipoyl(octanoyl) transferase